ELPDVPRAVDERVASQREATPIRIAKPKHRTKCPSAKVQRATTHANDRYRAGIAGGFELFPELFAASTSASIFSSLAPGKYFPARTTPAIFRVFLMSSSGLASSNTRSAIFPCSTVPRSLS